MKKILPFGLVVLILGFLGWRFLGSKPAVTEDEPEPAPKLAEGITGADYDTSIRVIQRIEGSPESVVANMKGVLRRSAVDANESSSEWVKIDQMQLMGVDQDQNVRNDLLNKPALSTFVVADQAFTHYFSPTFPHEFIPFHASLLHRLLLPFRYDDLKGKSPLNRKEQDEISAYESTYTLDESKRTIVKTWTRYLKEGTKVDANANSFTYTFDTSGQVEDLKGQLMLHYRQTPPMSFLVEVSLHKIGPSSAKIALVDKAAAAKVSDADIAASSQESPDRSNLPFQEALAKVDTITDTSNAGEAYKIFTSLKAGIDEDPSRAAEVISRIEGTKERDPDSRRRLSVLFGALAQARDPGISEKLADMATSCPDNFCKIQAIAGVNSHPHPTADAARKMLSMGETSKDPEIASNAYLAAGAAGYRLEGAVPELTQRLIAASTDASKAPIKGSVLAAMGNHGSSAYLPTLEANLKDTNPSIRSASVYSMRYMPEDSVDKALINLVGQEKNVIVVRDALKALDYRNLSTEDYTAVAKQTSGLSDEETQKLGARVLLMAYREDPAKLEEPLRTLSEGTKNKDVKAYIEGETARIKADLEAAKATPVAPEAP